MQGARACDDTRRAREALLRESRGLLHPEGRAMKAASPTPQRASEEVRSILAGQRVDGVRRKIPALSTSTYLDSAGVGLPPLSVTRAMKDFVERWSREGESWEE